MTGFFRRLGRATRLISFVALCGGYAPKALAAPTGTSKPVASKAKAKKVRPPPASPARLRAQKLGLGTRKTAGELLAGRVSPEWMRSVGPTGAPSFLRFPVAKGWFVRGFGSGAGGYHQAIDIGGTLGSNVRAAAAGMVGYAGNELSGYGNIVMLIHPGGFITTYAHNAKNRVIAGQQVERGQVIAELGSTGKSQGPHVHFEFLYAGQNCDPAGLFRPGVRKRDGSMLAVPRVTWKQGKRRPAGLRCNPRKHHPGTAASSGQTSMPQSERQEAADDEATD